MKKIEKISVIGLGAIGSAYASKLVEMDPQSVQVIAEQERIERYKETGIIVNGQSYPFNYISPETQTEPADLILVAVKYDGLQQAIQDMNRHVGPDTIILSLMNGIASEEILASAYGQEKVLYAMCVAIDAVRNGGETTFSSIGRICFGEKTNESLTPKVQVVKDLFDQAGIPNEIPLNMQRTMWWKFMINVGVNQTSAVLNAPYGVFQKVKEAHELMVLAMQEVILLSQAVGVNLTGQDLDEFDKILHQLSPQGKTSMLQDIEAGRKTEVEYLAGQMCELGSKYNIPTPINHMLLRMIRAREQMNRLL